MLSRGILSFSGTSDSVFVYQIFKKGIKLFRVIQKSIDDTDVQGFW